MWSPISGSKFLVWGRLARGGFALLERSSCAVAALLDKETRTASARMMGFRCATLSFQVNCVTLSKTSLWQQKGPQTSYREDLSTQKLWASGEGIFEALLIASWSAYFTSSFLLFVPFPILCDDTRRSKNAMHHVCSSALMLSANGIRFIWTELLLLAGFYPKGILSAKRLSEYGK